MIFSAIAASSVLVGLASALPSGAPTCSMPGLFHGAETVGAWVAAATVIGGGTVSLVIYPGTAVGPGNSYRGILGQLVATSAAATNNAMWVIPPNAAAPQYQMLAPGTPACMGPAITHTTNRITSLVVGPQTPVATLNISAVASGTYNLMGYVMGGDAANPNAPRIWTKYNVPVTVAAAAAAAANTNVNPMASVPAPAVLAQPPNPAAVPVVPAPVGMPVVPAAAFPPPAPAAVPVVPTVALPPAPAVPAAQNAAAAVPAPPNGNMKQVNLFFNQDFPANGAKMYINGKQVNLALFPPAARR